MVGVPQEDSGDKSVVQKTQEHNQALFRQQQIQKENATVQQQRQNAPGNIKEGTFEAQQVRKEESQDAQQAYFGGGFQQKGSSADSFVAQREAALKSGKFDYSAVRSSFYSPPSNFVNTKGERVVRTPNPAPEQQVISFGTPVSGPSSAPQQMAVLISKTQTKTPITPVIPPAQSTNPELRQAVLSTFINDPSALKYTGTSKGSYLYSLFQKGVLASSDFDLLNQLSTSYNAKVQQQNKEARLSNIQASLKTQKDVTDNLTSAQKAGVTSVNILDSQGNVIGTVNPQNIGQARLQTLKLLSRSGGVGLSYNVSQSTSQQGITSTVTTYQPSNVLTAFTGGALAGFAEAGLIGLGLVSKLTGKEFTVPGNTTVIKPTGIIAQAESKVQKTFGAQTLDQLISGQKVDLSNPIAIASLTGFGASLIATGGTGGIKAVLSAPSRIVEALRAPQIAKAITTRELQEGSALSQLSKIKGSKTLFEFEQGTAGKSAVTSTKMEDIIKVERLPSGKVQAVKVQQPKEVKITSPEKEVTTVIPYAVIGASAKGATSIVTKGVTNLTPQEIAIKGLPLEVGKAMGLKQIAETGGFPIFKGKLTSKNIPILMEEIRTGQIKPSFDILQFTTKDIVKGGGRYGMMARSPEMLSSNAFERVVRPNVLRYFESRVELEKQAASIPKKSGGMRPIGTIREGKGGAGASGRSQALTQEEKSIVQTLTKEKLGTKESNLKTGLTTQTTRTGLSSAVGSRMGTSQQEETIFIQSPKGLTKTVSLGEIKQEPRQGLENQISKLVNPKTKTTAGKTTATGLIVKTTPVILTTPITTSTTTQKQVTVPITTPKQTLKQDIPTFNPNPQVPDTTKRPPFIPLLGGAKSGGLLSVSKKGARKTYIGNVPIESLVGVYKRSEVTYTNKSASQINKKQKTTSNRNFKLLGSKSIKL